MFRKWRWLKTVHIFCLLYNECWWTCPYAFLRCTINFSKSTRQLKQVVMPIKIKGLTGGSLYTKRNTYCDMFLQVKVCKDQKSRPKALAKTDTDKEASHLYKKEFTLLITSWVWCVLYRRDRLKALGELWFFLVPSQGVEGNGHNHSSYSHGYYKKKIVIHLSSCILPLISIRYFWDI